MRHKYPSEAIVLARTPVAEESVLLTLLTREVGLVRARAQGIRKPGAKLASALQTLCESDVTLVAGKDGWRMSGALLRDDWFGALSRDARIRAGRVASLLLRLVHGESPDAAIFDSFKAYLEALRTYPEASYDAAECLAALRLLSLLGLDAGEVPGKPDALFAPESLTSITDNRSTFVARVNRGIAASGL